MREEGPARGPNPSVPPPGGSGGVGGEGILEQPNLLTELRRERRAPGGGGECRSSNQRSGLGSA